MLKPIQSTLDMLDEGLRIYRRGFVGFMLITAIWLVPIAIVVGISFAAVAFLGTTATVLMTLGWMLLALPLGFYLVGGLSRAALAVQQGRGVSLREALAIPPLRLAEMGCYGLIFGIIASIATSVIVCALLCAFYFAAAIGFGGIAAAFSNAGNAGTGIVSLMVILAIWFGVLIYGFSMVISGVTYSSLVYGLQPFALDDISFGPAVQRSIDLLFYRFGRNLLAFLLASAIFSAISVAVTLAIATLLPLPLLFALGQESPITQGVGASAWLLGLIVVLPPMPIWMALLYRRNQDAREGRDLVQRMEQVVIRDEPQRRKE